MVVFAKRSLMAMIRFHQEGKYMKLVVFNVGSALCVYAEHQTTRIVFDIGKGNNFSPVNDFLLPLYEKRGEHRLKNRNNRYGISQLIVSHPHKDHISDIQEFDKNFYAHLLTTPNSKSPNGNPQNINWRKITTPDDPDVKYLKRMKIGRNLPLRSFDSEHLKIGYLWPLDVENNSELLNESYTNNVSIVCFLSFGNYRVFLLGDLQKLLMGEFLNKKKSIRNSYAESIRTELANGVDFLICPHHGLKSSFSVDLFSSMKDGKTNKLNIIPEKSLSSDDVRTVDSRYSTSEYCKGNNNLSTKDKPVYQRKTSNGHIYINENGDVEVLTDITDVINRFLS